MRTLPGTRGGGRGRAGLLSIVCDERRCPVSQGRWLWESHSKLREVLPCLGLFAHRHFELLDRKDPQEMAKLFSVPDFVGDACKAIASRVRGAVASVTFDDFHKNSARIIRTAVFGFQSPEAKGPGGEALPQPRDRAVFPQNGLVVSSVDVQSVEPVDQRTRDALQRSVQLAIEITTNSQEAAAK